MRSLAAYLGMMLFIALLPRVASAQQECHGPRGGDGCATSSTTGFPIFSYAPETSAAFGGFGVHYFRLGEAPVEARPSYLAADALYTFRNQALVDLFPTFWFGPSLTRAESRRVLRGLEDGELSEHDRWWLFERHSITGQVAYRLMPDYFYGVGPNTNEANEELYTMHSFWDFMDFRTRVWGPLMVGVRQEFQLSQVRDVNPTGLLAGTRGVEGGVRSGLGLSVVWDSRDNLQSAHTGAFHQAFAITYPGFLGSRFHFTHINIDLRQYVQLAPHHVLAMQLYADFNMGDVPFDQLSLLGGNARMRGSYMGRYRDNDYLAAQVEWRIMPVVWRFGLVFFAGIGGVAPTIAEFRATELKMSLGGGIRFALDEAERIYVRLDVGCSTDGCAPYVNALEAF
ncbi:MAG: BamA/TamA family outer membrane protein [Sandaracinaceae bacterium]|nr:BamA/TamA family outer membrane protein [Sandaracinaceae bacterium]